ncbi:MAG: hypothetical protein Q7R33_00620, partial [Nitrosarchaeum sp.]|nr:hypothetical protein [Nitrosarchaeum sp.]
KFEKLFKEFEIKAIDEVEENKDKKQIWAIIEECIQKKTKTGKPFIMVKCSGRSEKMFDFKVWDQQKTPEWDLANVIVLDLEFDQNYGFALSRNCKAMVL